MGWLACLQFHAGTRIVRQDNGLVVTALFGHKPHDIRKSHLCQNPAEVGAQQGAEASGVALDIPAVLVTLHMEMLQRVTPVVIGPIPDLEDDALSLWILKDAGQRRLHPWQHL